MKCASPTLRGLCLKAVQWAIGLLSRLFARLEDREQERSSSQTGDKYAGKHDSATIAGWTVRRCASGFRTSLSAAASAVKRPFASCQNGHTTWTQGTREIVTHPLFVAGLAQKHSNLLKGAVSSLPALGCNPSSE